ncbi:M15 family metallopeptidase [Shewanella waksmanii]|uniref:M15 family metallopeptidase n=1 Tax=Shewanella waksmanii TaxID=213783 RepID=UPI0037360CAE
MQVTPIDNGFLYGLDAQHLIEFQGHLLEASTAKALMQMQQAAQKDGINIAICSAYRDFDKQMQIWNLKACGKRRLLDKNNQLVDANNLNANDLIDTILIWSALPGTSRHHWGTDIDIFDSNCISQSDLRLVSDEYMPGGPCHALFNWMQSHAHKFGFYRPYQAGLSGVSPEPWHYSYYPSSHSLLKLFRTADLALIINNHDLAVKQALAPRLPELVNQYVMKIAPAPDLHKQEQFL